MLFDIITLFPEMFPGYIHQSILKRAQKKGLVSIRVHNLRDFTLDKHRKVDDVPYGGGPGMVLTAEPAYRAVTYLTDENLPAKRIFLSPQGRLFSQQIAEELLKESHIIFLCGHYEGIDQRIRDSVIDDEISIGDYILTGGELPALVVLDSVIRLIPGVLGSGKSLQCESFLDSLLDYPQYTRPEIFNHMEVPPILLSGHHEKIRKWRRKQSLIRTSQKRPDLFQKIKMTDEDIELLKDYI